MRNIVILFVAALSLTSCGVVKKVLKIPLILVEDTPDHRDTGHALVSFDEDAQDAHQ